MLAAGDARCFSGFASAAVAAAPMHPALYTRASMIREIAAAVGFISKFLRTKGLMNERQLQTFSQSLQELLAGEGRRRAARGCSGEQDAVFSRPRPCCPLAASAGPGR
uniref:Anti-proliferative protein domain-containing protein n=1 Tax=Gopherus agassizii TaxID=38772 RepID=A0A452HJH2_9SAUR